MNPTQLNDRFNTHGAIHFESANGGLTRAALRFNDAEAHVYLHGAHVTHYRPAGGHDVLFMSRQSHFDAAKPIRGGIPICFPWFSNAHDPTHGFARLTEWTVESTRQTADFLELTLAMTADPQASSHWPHSARLRYTLRLGASLELALEVTNTSAQPITYEEALHTYLAVSDVRQARLFGLKGATFIDKTQSGVLRVQEIEPLVLSQYTDRPYLHTAATCTLEDPAWNRQIQIAKTASNVTVVWNPWIERAIQMDDFEDEQWPDMLCVESANVGPLAIQLPPGRSHTMTTTFNTKNLVR